MNNKTLRNQKGQTLPITLMLITTITATVAVVGYSIMAERKFINEDKKRLDISYAAESGQQYGRSQIKSYLLENLDDYILAIKAPNMNVCLLGDTPKERNGIFNGNSTLSFPAFSSATAEQIYMDKITLIDNNTTKYNRISNPVKFKTYFFNDKDSDEILETGEEGFQWLSYENTTTEATVSQVNKFSYNITSYGYYPVGNGKFVKKKINSSGIASITIGRESFSKFALFTNFHADQSGNKVWFTENTSFKGPVHTNGEGSTNFNFLGTPGPTFTDVVTSGTNTVTWYNNGSSLDKDFTTGSYAELTNKSGSTIRDKATFKSNIKIGVKKEALPTNSLSQAKAAMGGDASDTSALTLSQQAQLLGLPSNSSSIPKGIYVPKVGTSATGGIYVNGDVKSLTMGVDNSNNQVYNIVQDTTVGSTTTTTTKVITTNRTTNQTTVVTTTVNPASTSTQILNNILKGTIHVDGKILSLGGPSRTNATLPNTAGSAISSLTALTISATSDITVNRDIKYQTDPRGPDKVFGTVDDKIDAKNVLGLFSSGGDVIIGSEMPNNADLHATVMASGGNGAFKVADHGSTSKGYRGEFNLLGGAITDKYGAFGLTDMSAGYTRKFDYDKRMEDKMSPPFFPTTSSYVAKESKYEIADWNEGMVNR